MRGKHPNSRANLKPFKKGQTGNPKGRPLKYTALKKALKKIGDEEYNEFDNGYNVKTKKKRFYIISGKKLSPEM